MNPCCRLYCHYSVVGKREKRLAYNIIHISGITHSSRT